eukprot:SAG11_NODE_253_length_11591_cov_15.933693_7_plen_125_part_00
MQSLAKFVYERHSGTTDANAGSTDGESAIEKQKIYNARLTKRDLEVLHQIAYGVTKKNKQRHTSVAELMDLDDEEARQMEAISSQIDSSVSVHSSAFPAAACAQPVAAVVRVLVALSTEPRHVM